MIRKYPKEVVKQWVEDVNSEGKGLTEWESQFMEDITDQLDMTGSLSPKQTEIVERIYTERVK